MRILNFSALIYPASAPDNAPIVYDSIPLEPSSLKEHLDKAAGLPVSEVKAAAWKALYLNAVNNINPANVVVSATLGDDEKVFAMEIPMDGTDLDEAIFCIEIEFMANLRNWLYSSTLNSPGFRTLITAEIIPSITT